MNLAAPPSPPIPHAVPVHGRNGVKHAAAPGFQIQSLEDVRNLIRAIGGRCRAMVQGRDDVIYNVLTALLADGHILLEDYPGSGKTTLAKALGQCLAAEPGDNRIAPFRRIQFTPDLLPSDVTGVTIFDSKQNKFVFHGGPIFANVVLADEINRTSPKVQAALLEAMGEKQVTVDNQTHRLDDLFFVLATQNPLDLMGTYPLPQAQLDRFLFKIKMTHLTRASELEVLARWKGAQAAPPQVAVSPRMIIEARKFISNCVLITPQIHECLVDIANALRQDRRVALGVSTRSLVLALPALQARAVMVGRDFVSPQDIKALAVPLFSHRLTLVPGFKDADTVVTECVTPIVEHMTRRSLQPMPVVVR
jgi:MoxR-like ATPase